MALAVKNMHENLIMSREEYYEYYNHKFKHIKEISRGKESLSSFVIMLIVESVFIFMFLQGGLIIFYDTSSIAPLAFGIYLSISTIMSFVILFCSINKGKLVKEPHILNATYSIVRIVYGLYLIIYFGQTII